MRESRPLSGWDRTVAAFLSSRRVLGRAYRTEEHALSQLRKFLARAGVSDLTAPLFDAWRRSSVHLSISTRLRLERTVHKFCRYRRRTEPRCFLPDPSSFVRLKPYPLPTIISRSQVARLLAACSPKARRTGRSRLHGEIMRFAIVLLYTAGLRRGELIRLTLSDVDVKGGVLRIRDSKFHKSRWIPLSPSAIRELRRYLRIRRQTGFDQRLEAPLICTLKGGAYVRSPAQTRGRSGQPLCELRPVAGQVPA